MGKRRRGNTDGTIVWVGEKELHFWSSSQAKECVKYFGERERER